MAVELFRYTDKLTGEERGICYSDKDGNPAIQNPDWNIEEISEKNKEYYINLQSQQMKQRENVVLVAKTAKKNKAKAKLRIQGFTDEEIEEIIN